MKIAVEYGEEETIEKMTTGYAKDEDKPGDKDNLPSSTEKPKEQAPAETEVPAMGASSAVIGKGENAADGKASLNEQVSDFSRQFYETGRIASYWKSPFIPLTTTSPEAQEKTEAVHSAPPVLPSYSSLAKQERVVASDSVRIESNAHSAPSESVAIGRDIATNRLITLGDTGRRRGLYVLGRSGTGKSWLLVNLALQDIRHGHGIVFLDPHDNAIDELMRRPVFDDDRRLTDYILFNPECKTHSFGINLLACRNIADLNERQDTYTRAKGVFDKIWKTAYYELPWLQEILQYTLYAFIENQDYTLGDVQLFLTDKSFRNHIVANMRYNSQAIDFWRNRFDEKRAEAALTRVDTLLGYPYVHAIVSQRQTTLDFTKIIEDRQVALIKLSDRLPTEIKTFIGTIIISELVHTIKKRSTDNPHQFCVFVDEFQNFSSYEDFSP